jgi:hypothetical protein
MLPNVVRRSRETKIRHGDLNLDVIPAAIVNTGRTVRGAGQRRSSIA